MPTEPGTTPTQQGPRHREPDAAWPGAGGSAGGWTYRMVWNPATGQFEMRKEYSPGEGGGGGSAPIGGGGGGTAPGAGAGAGTGAGAGAAGTGSAFANWLKTMGWQDWTKLGLGAYGLFGSGGSGSGGVGPVGAVPGMNPIIGQVGYGNLLDVLMSNGRTSPDLMNRDLAAINRGTQSQQMGLQGGLAQRGLSRSGIGQALGSAIGQAGENRSADRMAQETAMAEQRRRQDLDLFLRLFVGPNLDTTALATGQYNANRQYDSQKDAARLAAIAQIIGAFS